jgi:hypothetical protein
VAAAPISRVCISAVAVAENDLWSASVAQTYTRFSAVVSKATAVGARVLYMGTKPEPDTSSLWCVNKYAVVGRRWPSSRGGGGQSLAVVAGGSSSAGRRETG